MNGILVISHWKQSGGANFVPIGKRLMTVGALALMASVT